jgi:hypothetical protein
MSGSPLESGVTHGPGVRSPEKAGIGVDGDADVDVDVDVDGDAD